MKEQRKTVITYIVSVTIALAVGAAASWVNAGNMNTSAVYAQPPLSPPGWLFPAVWTILYTLMGISAAKVYLSDCTEKTDALFVYCVQLTVNFLWTIFFFTFGELLLSFLWLVFLILLVLLMIVRFFHCDRSAGKLQVPYLIWLCFAAYLNLALWLLNR